MAEIAVLPSLESAKGKLEQNGFPFAGLPNDRNSLLWGDIRRECGLSLAEVSFLQNASAGTTSKSVMFHYLCAPSPTASSTPEKDKLRIIKFFLRKFLHNYPTASYYNPSPNFQNFDKQYNVSFYQ